MEENGARMVTKASSSGLSLTQPSIPTWGPGAITLLALWMGPPLPTSFFLSSGSRRPRCRAMPAQPSVGSQ